MSETITDFEHLLEPFLSEEETILSYKTTRLPDENCNVIFSIEVSLRNGTNLYLIAKTVPPKQFSATQITFRKEIAFYSIVAPTLTHFQEKEDVDELFFLPEYYGGRFSLTSTNETVDNDAVLLLENLKVQGYENVDGRKGFNLATSRQILKDLASFHAIPIALKVKDGRIFDIKLKRHLSKRTDIKYSQIIVKNILKFFEEGPECVPYLAKIRERLEEPPGDTQMRVPFSTMIHGNCCAENIVIKSGSDGSSDIKLIDFQCCGIGSLAEDLILFLYSSVDTEVLEEHVDGLIQFYHSNLVRVLEECKCDPTQFSIDALLKEMKIVAEESLFARVIVTIYLIFEAEEASQTVEKVSTLLDQMRKKIMFAVKEFARKGWI